MKIAGWIFLVVGIMLLSLGILWIQVDMKMDIINVGALAIGGEMILIGHFLFLKEAKNPDLKSKWERKNE